MRALLGGADSVLLLARMRAAQAELGKRVNERGLDAGPVPVDLTQFATSLRVAWSAGEGRPTHRRRYVRRKPLVRPSLLDGVRERIVAWLDEQPSLPVVGVLERLCGFDRERSSQGMSTRCSTSRPIAARRWRAKCCSACRWSRSRRR